VGNEVLLVTAERVDREEGFGGNPLLFLKPFMTKVGVTGMMAEASLGSRRRSSSNCKGGGKPSCNYSSNDSRQNKTQQPWCVIKPVLVVLVVEQMSEFMHCHPVLYDTSCSILSCILFSLQDHNEPSLDALDTDVVQYADLRSFQLQLNRHYLLQVRLWKGVYGWHTSGKL
jgi:hypothetical protein